MSDVMMTLGAFKFQVRTAAFQELNRATEWRWPQQEVFGLAPVLQSLGKGADTITLPGVVFPHWNGGRFMVEGLRTLAAEEVPHFMIDGTGQVLGRWVIERIEERQAVFGPSGAPLRQEFTVSLRKFDDLVPPPIEAPAAAVAAAPVVEAAAEAAQDVAQETISKMGAAVSTLSAAAANIQALADEAAKNVKPVIDAIRQGITAAQNLKNAATEAQRLADAVGKIKDLRSVEEVLGSMQRVASSSNAAAAGASRVIGTQSGSLAADGAPANLVGAVHGATLTMNRLQVGVAAARNRADKIVGLFK